jgi:uroporphyrinogen-III synthase
MLVLLPQADIAAPTVFEGLMAKGWQVLPVTAYRTVDYPARPELRLTAELEIAAREPADDLELISAADFRSRAGNGTIDAVVLTSPSVTRRLAGLLDPWPAGLRLIAIGTSSARQAAELGLEVAATAAEPTPPGIADALAWSLENHPTEPEGTP